MYYVYILACLETKRSYVGSSENLLQRFAAHKAGGTRTTRARLARPVMVYWEPHPTRPAAVHRERYFKQGAGNRLKKQLVAEALRRDFDLG